MRIIAGDAKGRVIEAPAGMGTRPTLDRVRENMFNMLQKDIPGSRVLDLFAGSGALSLESLSRGAEFAVLVDADRKACDAQKRNIEVLGYEKSTRMIRGDWRAAIHQLQNEKEQFDIVFLDPPYSMLDLTDVFSELHPVVSRETLIVLEHEAKKHPIVPALYCATKNRAWGFCGITIYQTGIKESE